MLEETEEQFAIYGGFASQEFQLPESVKVLMESAADYV